MRTWRAVIAAVLALMAATSVTHAADPTWVGIGGPAGWPPSPGFELEIGDDAWRIDDGGGVTTVDITSPTVVRVRQLPGCDPVVRFVADPGRMYFIRFAADGSADVEVLSDIDAGPALEGPTEPVCPALPDTSTAEPSPLPPGGLPLVAVAAGLLAVIVILSRPRRRAR